MPDPVDTSRLWRSSFCIYSRPAPCSSFSTNLRFAVDLHLPQHNSISTSHPYLSHPQRQYYLYTFMSTGERSTSRGRALVRGLYLPLSGYSSSHDHINRYRPSSSCRHHSALPNSNPLAVVAQATGVLRPLITVLLRVPVPMTSRTPAAETSSLRAIPTW